MKTQVWWKSPVVLASIGSKIALVLALFLSAGQLNIYNVVLGVIVGIMQIISDANNPTNKMEWGANK